MSSETISEIEDLAGTLFEVFVSKDASKIPDIVESVQSIIT